MLVFDCDGVLVDSEALVVEVEARLLTDAGFPVTVEEIVERYVGLSYATMMAELGERFGRPVPDELSRSIQQAAIDELPKRLEPVAGIEALLNGSTEPRCVASSSDVDRIELSLQVTGLDRQFVPDRIFSAQMVQNGKPAPDLFLLAASRVGADPADCVVIEDSPAGVTAGVAAGMTVVGLLAGRHVRPSLADRLRTAGAARLFETTEELAGWLDGRP